ncbi:MAG: geranylgeranyl reductase family protein [Halobacteriota archaeon]
MEDEHHDVVVAGGGTAGCFAAAEAAKQGLDVVLLERKPESEAGHIACGDALKGASSLPDSVDTDRVEDESFTNTEIRRGIFEYPSGDEVEIPFPETGCVMDRRRFGEVLLDEAERAGADVRYDTVVNDVLQNGSVSGVRAVSGGEAVEIHADVTVDAAGALSVLQDHADLSGASYDTSARYTQYCSAYREIIEVPEPVDYEDALVFKPTEELGYLWYFPRTPTTINAGLGFQMNEPPMELVDALKSDLERRPEFEDAEVVDKLGAALPTRRPFDSAVAPGFVSVGDAAGHVNPCTGGGIAGAAHAGAYAARAAVDAVEDGDAGEEVLWRYNVDVMEEFGGKFAAMDLYNVFGTAHELDELVDLVSAIPGQQLVDALGREGTASMPLWLKLKTLWKARGHWSLLYELYRVQERAAEIKDVYADYPGSPEGFDGWRERRDSVVDEVYELTGADAKY